MSRNAMRFSILLLIATAGCRQATGLDDFEFPSCAPGEAGCAIPAEDCVAGVDSNADGIPPASCTGKIAWARSTEADGPRTCPGSNDTIDASRHLTALRSFGSWTGALGTVRGSLGACDQSLCTLESFAHDPSGEGLVFAPRVPCEDSSLFGELARGADRAHAASALGKDVAVSSHRLGDGSFASRWSFEAPEAVTSLALTAGATAVLALGQKDHTLLVQPDSALPTARFHTVQGTDVSALALSGTTLLLAGIASSANGGVGGSCAVAKSTAFIAEAQLGKGSGDAGSPSSLSCERLALELEVGADAGSPIFRIASVGSRVCWVYAGTSGTQVRELRTGCFDLGDPSFRWQTKGDVGKPSNGAVDIAMDPFGNVVLAAMIDPSKPISWGGGAISPVVAGSPNVAVLKLAGPTGEVVWARVFASPGGDLREPHVSVNDGGLVQLGVVTDEAALIGNDLSTLDGAPGPRVQFVGIEP